MNDENYYQISGWMINKLKLKGIELNVYAIIYGFSQDGESEFKGSLQYLCDFTGGTSKPTIIKALKELTEKGFIIRREEIINKVKFNRYRANLPLLKNFNGGGKEILMGGSKETLPNNEILDNNIDNDIIYIVEYLNDKANVNFRATTKKTQSLLKSLLTTQGFSVNDCITVIDKKCKCWLGTEFAKYLRPETLFGNKFESYLNEPITIGGKKGNSFDDTMAGLNKFLNDDTDFETAIQNDKTFMEIMGGE